MRISNIRLAIQNITGRNDSCANPLETSVFQQRGENAPTEVSVRIQALGGDQKVKLPADPKMVEKVRGLERRLANGDQLFIEFDGLTLRAYAFLTQEGKLLSGVSAQAENFREISQKVSDTFDEITL